MARLEKIIIEGYRSIQHPVEIKFPNNMPVVLIGENNAGKSNIVRAIDILFGEQWPGSQSLEDHDVWGRSPDQEVQIKAFVSAYNNTASYNRPINGFIWESKPGNNKTNYEAIRSDNGQKVYSNNDLHNELTTIKIDAERNLSYQLSYASKWTLLSKVMKAFHDKLISDKERVEKLKGLFEDIKDTFEEVDEFQGFSDQMSSITDEMLEGLTYNLKIDFSAYDPSNYFKSLRVNPVEGNEARNFDEIGTGQQQVLALSFAHAYSKAFISGDIILIIEEPESHLHPLAQRWLARTMHQMAKDGLQVLITTHTPNFLNVEFLEGIFLIRKNEDGTYIKNNNAKDLAEYCISKGADPNRTKEDTVVPFYDNHSTFNILSGFFASKIILVEGPTEELALPIYLKKVGLDCLREGVEIISVDGKGNLAKWWRFFTLYNIPTFICFDNDGSSDGDGNRRKDALKAIGIPEEELDGVLSIDNWNINEHFCVFGTDFETTMKATIEGYDQLEQEVIEELGNSKHIVARTVCQRLEYNEEDEGWEKMVELAEKIKELEN